MKHLWHRAASVAAGPYFTARRILWTCGHPIWTDHCPHKHTQKPEVSFPTKTLDEL